MLNPFRSRIRWILIFWMFIISAIAYLDRVNISIAGSSIAKDYGLDNIQLGWVFSAFVLAYALFQAPGGRLSDYFGPRKVLFLGTIWWGVFTALTAMVPAGMAGALIVILAVRFCLGIGEAVVYPASNRLVANWVPFQERGKANGLIFCGTGAGAGITPPLITFILMNYGWRWSFYVSALIGLVAGLVWLWLARDRPEQHPWVKPQEAEHIRSGLSSATAKTATGNLLSWGTILKNGNVQALTLSYFTFGYSAYIFYTWFFIYLNTVRGLDLKASSYYSMLPFLSMAVGSLLGGWICDRVTKRYGKRMGRCGIAVVGLGLAAIFIALGTRAQDAALASIILAGGAGAVYLSQSSYWSVTADIAGASAGSVSGVMNMGAQIGGAITASLTPLIAKHFGWSASFLVAAALCLIGSLAWLKVNPERELVRAPE